MKKETDTIESICRQMFGLLGTFIVKVKSRGDNINAHEGRFKYKKRIKWQK